MRVPDEPDAPRFDFSIALRWVMALRYTTPHHPLPNTTDNCTLMRQKAPGCRSPIGFDYMYSIAMLLLARWRAADV